MKVINEEKVEQRFIDQFADVAQEGMELVGCDSNDPLKIMTAINDFLTKPIKKKWFKKVDNWTDKSLPIGTLWGETYVKELGWEWLNITFEDESQAVGVFNKDRSLGIYPWFFVFGVTENGAPTTVLLAWNMLKEGGIPIFKPNDYENLMEGVHHIIPV